MVNFLQIYQPTYFLACLWLSINPLTHLSQDKMATFSQTIFSDAFSWMESFVFLIKMSLKFVPKGPIDNNPALVQIMAWRWIDDKPLSEPMLTLYTDIYAALGGAELMIFAKYNVPCRAVILFSAGGLFITTFLVWISKTALIFTLQLFYDLFV